MKTLGQFTASAAPLALAVSVVFFSGSPHALGQGRAGNVGGANGTVTTGGMVVAGGARTGVSAAGSTSIRSTGATIPAARNGVSFSNSMPRTAVNAPTQGASVRGSAPSALSLPYRNVPSNPASIGVVRPANSQSAFRPNNAWSGTAVNPTNTITAQGPARPPNTRTGNPTNRFTGQVLYPGTNGSNLPTTNSGNNGSGRRNGRSSFRLPGRYYYYPYAYGPAYAPYISYYGSGGYPAYEGAYPYSNDVVTNEADINPGAGAVSPQYVERNPDANADSEQPAPARQQQPGAQQPRNSANAAQGTIPNNGPDSLVEAVQEELIRRGYFGGKVDAMFNPETKDALRKFQVDRHLAETGLINEATLHALQLD